MKKNNNDCFFSYTNEYLSKYLRNQTGKSENTIESYRDALTVFRKFLLEVKGIKIMKFMMTDCSKELLLDYMEYMKNQGKKNTTINHHITVIKNYLWYVSDVDITYQSLAISVSHIPALRIPVKNQEILSNQALQALFSIPKANKKGMRNRTIMILLYETAVRVGELLDLKVSDLFLDINTPYLLIHGKGDKERVVSLSKKAKEHLEQYINIYKPQDYVFYSTIHGVTSKLSESTVEAFIQKYADEIRIKDKSVDIPEKVHPHMFRHSRATHLYQDGIPVELISRMLGHSSTETTRKFYAKPSLEQMKSVIENENDINIKPEWENEDEIACLLGIR
ncbi:tyrosine-type recombinase/integrase [[Clostridium] spiroforme]|nr:tyrosine-type recombinase/integrase [Thomasclavelia spiroformis]